MVRTVVVPVLLNLPAAQPTAAYPYTYVDVHIQADGRPTVWRIELPPDVDDRQFRLAEFRAGQFRVLHFEEQPYGWTFIRRLSGDRLLLVEHCALDEASVDADESVTNAEVFDRHGQRLSAFHVGDAVQDVQVTTDDRIWCSHYDEAQGYYTSAECYDWQGTRLFNYGDLARAQGLPGVIDCYAMNVATTSETWLYYYSDFPLVQLVDWKLAGFWPSVPTYAQGFAVHEQQVLFAQSYRERLRLALFDRATGAVEQLDALDAFGNPIPFVAGNDCTGRGPRLYLRSGQQLYGLDLRTPLLIEAGS